MDWTPVFAGIVSAIGGAVVAWFGMRAKTRAAELTQEERFVRQLIAETEKLRLCVTDRDATIAELQHEVRELSDQVARLRKDIEHYESTKAPGDSPQLLESIVNSLPYPAWIHEVGANNWYVNEAYADAFHVRRSDFWTPINVLRFYPASRAASYVAHDMAVVEANVGKLFEEKIPRRVMEPASPENEEELWDVVKIPIRAGGRNYVFGACQRTGLAPTSLICGFKDETS